MRTLPIYQVDAFATNLFEGNPAAVCPLDSWLTDKEMQNIALENNLSETAFFIPEENGFYIRWFTPNEEVALCGHATLASAYVIFEKLGFKGEEIKFRCLSGDLVVRKNGKGFVMDFPALPYHFIEYSEALSQLNLNKPRYVLKSKFDLMFVYDTTQEVKQADPNLNAVAQLDYRGLILTAPGINSDIYSRCFYPGCNVAEDPVTGSAHCVIAPYWSERLQKGEIHAVQGGMRQGKVRCEVRGERVFLYGAVQLYLQGTIYLP
ncbi:PhzF family phenazine biosynthesis protein [Legionella sainthelensi]|uniref:PhzF family phenazine biosynthesis protein n=1 Tax=Legionella sainthelensi TaxID=28087 RepID=UPI000E1FD47A|nr:PhzF family phenazine biosynthesis protein [Legionella sainthelensi]